MEEEKKDEKAPVHGLNLGADETGRIAELQKELQSERVEKGRLAKANDELRATKDELAKLRAELEDYKRRSKDYESELPEDMREGLDPSVIKAVGYYADKRASESEERIRKYTEAQRQEIQRSRKEEFLRRVDSAYPGFLESTDVGGDKADAWGKFLLTYRPSVLDALNTCNMQVMGRLIEQFYSEIGIQNQRNGKSAPTPSPSNTTNGPDPNAGQMISFEEYSKRLEEAGRDVRSGKISRQDYNKIKAELIKAQTEGRVTY